MSALSAAVARLTALHSSGGGAGPGGAAAGEVLALQQQLQEQRAINAQLQEA
ncbi:hypothetical protein MNEG_13873, partial [Monoraphidium neglectum]